MDYCLTSKSNDCKNCYKCIRHCPTKSISFSNNQASIIHDECVLCGRCYLNCPQGTKVIRDDVEKAKQLIASGKQVIVSLAPSFVANYRGATIDTMRKALLSLGFSQVEETAIGATIVKKAYDEMLQDGTKDIIISSCCHSVNLLIQKHYPKVLPYLADVLSPMLAHGEDIKARYKGAAVVFIGPCIAKKDEADKNSDLIDVALTYLELTRWLKEAKIEIERKPKSEVIAKSKARLFPTSGGILATMEKSAKDYDYLVIDGMGNVLQALEDIQSGKLHKTFIEMSSCSGSCINGPALEPESRSVLVDSLAVYHHAGKEDFEVSSRKYEEIKKNFYQIQLTRAKPSEQDIERVLKEMGKTSKNKELNCGSCGYNTCRDKAIAILRGKAVKEMCLPYLMEKERSFSNTIVSSTPNGIMVLNENLEIQLLNKAMCSIIGVEGASSLINKSVTTILQPDLYAKVLGTTDPIHGIKEYLPEYDRYVEETIVFDKKFHVIISIMRDITQEELALQKKDELVKKSVEMTDRVIAKNMRSVQEIASLLGETAAETKVALSSLKDTLKDDDK